MTALEFKAVVGNCCFCRAAGLVSEVNISFRRVAASAVTLLLLRYPGAEFGVDCKGDGV